MSFRQAFEGALLEILRTRDLVAVAVISVLFYAFLLSCALCPSGGRAVADRGGRCRS
ncbi:hypothetical protein [Sphingomonas sp. Ant H11]|uniref:hypothetical protein n=1 Tax=Sphingomonas sp. Ant H11 TaxID=1564113 RepID=UPI000AAA7FF2|nr:hypothetical protein [Sphingomonas sp. Ant H11]